MSRRAEIHPGSVAVFVASLVVLLSCGGGGGGTGTTTAPDGGAGNTSAAPDGGVSATGGGTTGGTADGGTDGSGGGGASHGGTAGDPCDGLAPAFATEITVPRGAGTHSTCDYATSHESGQVALSITSASGFGAGDANFSFYRPDGTPENTFVSFVSNVTPHQLLDPWFHPSSGGWQGLEHLGNPIAQVFQAWDAAGNVVGKEIPARAASSTSPTVEDGSIALTQDFVLGVGPVPGDGAFHLEWFDGGGIRIREAAIAGTPDMVLQAFGTGHVLVLDSTSTPWHARWYDVAGVPLTAGFDVAATRHVGVDPWFKLLLDGRVAINDGASWTAVLPDGQAHVDPVPPWLTARPGTRIATIRQGRGYAVMPLLFAGTSKFEILAPDGTSCGHFGTPAPAPPNGERWSPSSLNVGYDGTLTEIDFAFGGDLDASIHCVFRWWPALLR